MRILTWNINGIRTLPQYHPWNTFKNHDEILDNLQSDIVCFQEVKSSRAALPKSVAVPPSYHSFFSFPFKKTGYSGVAVYSRSNSVVPLKAEEGLTGLIQPKTPLGPEERVSKWENYPPQQEPQTLHNGNADEEDGEVDYKLLDGEGRALVIDFGLFVLINTYCPNDSSTPTLSRDKFKKQYHQLLSSRVESLIKNEKRQVIVLGDINACAAVIDHCEGDIMVSRARKANNLEKGDESGFWDCEGTGEGRKWLRDWLNVRDGIGGPMVDIVRRFWPERKGMYTCWNAKLSARETNYGTRIDYILITPGLIPWIKAANIQPEIKGSDHCPVYIDLYDEITAEDGTRTKLQDALGNTSEKEPPRLATKFWEEHSGRQMSLDKFFAGKKVKEAKDVLNRISPTATPPLSRGVSSSEFSTPTASTTITAAATPLQHPEAESFDVDANAPLPSPIFLPPPCTTTTTIPDSFVAPTNTFSNEISFPPASSSPAAPTLTVPVSVSTSTAAPTPPMASSQHRKRKIVPESQSSSPSTSKKKKMSKVAETKKSGQAKLSSFFDKPPPTTKASSSSTTTTNRSKMSVCTDDVIHIDDDDIVDADSVPSSSSPSSSQNLLQSSFHSQTQRNKTPNAGEIGEDVRVENKKEEKKQIWNSVFLNKNDIPKPKCLAHGVTAKEYTVNKQGVNKGKKFWLCSRPVGPGYDKGKAERLREEVDPQYRCNFFKWSSDWWRQVKQMSEEEKKAKV